ncbi:sulfatase [Colwellia psychrerythraea]|uniref:Sulfatase n=2 Tax=Colwellia psychrerythraea TaxID=28229 RepID=A0A099KQW6_COLPS|nr:sulfatase [Colwellia psychrerythraea]
MIFTIKTKMNIVKRSSNQKVEAANMQKKKAQSKLSKQLTFLALLPMISVGSSVGKVYAAQSANEALDTNQPNIVFIMSDDHAANAISSYQGRLSSVFKTPNIDRLATNGVRFNGMYANNAICSPSRAAILTGQYSHTNGVKTLADPLDRDKDNVAKQLQSAGYQTAIVGKWHLKTQPAGFDYYNVLPNQGEYFDPKLKEIGQKWQDGKKGGEVHPGYVTDVITDVSLNWLNNRDEDKPFMLMINHKAPHGLWQPAKRHENFLADVKIPEPDSLYHRGKHGPTDAVIIDGKAGQQFGSSVSRRMEGRGLVTRMLDKNWPTGPLELESYDWNTVVSAAYQKYLKDYLRTIKAVDENVGRVLDYLDANGLTENTLIIYTSDQGMMLGEHDYYDKRWIYEESIQMPFLVQAPKSYSTKEKAIGKTSEALFLNIDIAPTLLDLAGVNKPIAMQGQSFKAVLTQPEMAHGRDAIYYRYWLHMAHHTIPAHYGIRTKTHKLAFFYGLPLDANGAMPATTPPYWELYDLENDPKEMNNLYPSKQSSGIKVKLKAQLSQIKIDIGDTDEQYPSLMAVKAQHWGK